MSGPECRVRDGLRVGLSLDSSRLGLKRVVGQVLRPIWILLDTVLAIESGEAPSTLDLQPDRRWDRPRSTSKITSELWLCGSPGKSGAFGAQNGAVEKIHISICGHPTSSALLLLVVTLSMTRLGHSLPGGTSCPDFPSLCPLGPSGPAMPGLHPGVPCVGSQPSSLGISCHCGSVPGLCFCQVTPSPVTWVLSRSPGRAWELRDVGKVDQGGQVLSVAGPGSLSKTFDAWALGQLRADTWRTRQPDPELALCVT